MVVVFLSSRTTLLCVGAVWKLFASNYAILERSAHLCSCGLSLCFRKVVRISFTHDRLAMSFSHHQSSSCALFSSNRARHKVCLILLVSLVHRPSPRPAQQHFSATLSREDRGPVFFPKIISMTQHNLLRRVGINIPHFVETILVASLTTTAVPLF